MARIRTIKPELFRHEKLFEAESHHRLPLRLAFIGLFTCCDREGRFRWRPKQLKLDILPYDDIDFKKILDVLLEYHFISKYEIENEEYGFIPTWHKHQRINNRESESDIPAPISPRESSVEHACLTDDSRFNHSSSTQIQFPLTSLNNTQGEGEKEREKEKKRNKEMEWEEELEKERNAITSFVIHIPLIDKTNYSITNELLDKLKSLYPSIDVLSELRNIRAWNIANPTKQKTKTGIVNHIKYWLSNTQANGLKCNLNKPPTQNALESFNKMIGEQWIQESQMQEDFDGS